MCKPATALYYRGLKERSNEPRKKGYALFLRVSLLVLKRSAADSADSESGRSHRATGSDGLLQATR